MLSKMAAVKWRFPTDSSELTSRSACPILAFISSGVMCGRLFPAPLGWQLMAILIQSSLDDSISNFLAICRYSCLKDTSPIDIACIGKAFPFELWCAVSHCQHFTGLSLRVRS